MRLPQLIGEILRSTASQKVATVMVAVLTAAMCASTLLTVGRSAAAADQVHERLESAGARRLVVTDARSGGFLTASMVTVVSGLDAVERAIGLTSAVDVTNTALRGEGQKVIARGVVGDIHDAVELVEGRWPNPGEALVSATALDRLHMDRPVGAVTDSEGRTASVVGRFAPIPPYAELAEGAVIAAAITQPAHTIDVLVDAEASATVTERAVLATLDRVDPNDLDVRSPVGLAEVQAAVMGDLSEFSRRLMLLVLGVGGLLVAVVALSDVLLHRRDLGRRRAVGAARWVLVHLAVGRAVVSGVIGAILGTAVGIIATAALGQQVSSGFSIGTAILAVLTSGLATALPAMVAAYRDPVRVLRTP